MIYIIITCNWNPIAFNVWEDENGDLWALTGGTVSPNVVASALIKAHFNTDLRRAASHYDGLGMLEGIDFHATMALMRSLSNYYSYKCALESILSAATWPNQRVHECYPHVSSICSRCGSAPDTSLHCFWQCPENKNIDDEDVSRTQVLIPAAESGSLTHPCLWLRGILPSSFTKVESVPSNESNLQIIKDTSPQTVWASGTYYGDASGGEFTAYTCIRRVGCGLAAIDASGNLLFGAKSNLPGLVQTVPRGEIYALFMLVNLAIHSAVLDFVTDNKGLFNAYNKGPKFCSLTANCDLYASIYKLAFDKALLLTVRWMPSHLLEEPEKGVYSCMSNLDILGNDRADKLAVSAAKQACVSVDVSAPVLYYYSLVKRIQNRLATILINLPNRPKRQHEQKQVKPGFSFADALSSSSHVLYEQENRIACARCLCGFRCNDPAIKTWLSSQCVAIGSNIDRPIKLLYSHVHVGNQCAHVSHDLYMYRGLIYCNKCGARSGRLGIKLLSKHCEPPSVYGQQSLEALRQCKKPPGLEKWPSDPEHGDESQPPPPSTSYSAKGRKRKGAFITFFIRRPRPIVTPTHTPPPIAIASHAKSDSSPKEKCPLPNYLSNLQDLIELEEIQEKVIWPDGLNAIRAKLLINNYIHEWENNRNKGPIFKSLEQVDQATLVGDPNQLPPVHTKEVRFTTHQPLTFAPRNKRKFIYGKSYDQLQSKQLASTSSSSGEPSAVPAAKTSLDDSDLSLSESDVT